MHREELTQSIVREYDSMPRQLQVAARYVLDNPHDVALLSMRQQARRARVMPATMTRLAQFIGLDGYQALRRGYAEAIRYDALGFASRAGEQLRDQEVNGDNPMAANMVASLARHFSGLDTPSTVDRLAQTASLLAAARRIYCIGLRSSYGPAWHFRYILSLFGNNSVLLDGVANTGVDPLREATREDVLFAVSVAPYTRATLDVAKYAADQGVRVVVLTDSEVAPLAQIADAVVVTPIESPSFFHTMAPAYALAEVLAVLVAGHGGGTAIESLRRADEQLAAFDTHIYVNRRQDLE